MRGALHTYSNVADNYREKKFLKKKKATDKYIQQSSRQIPATQQLQNKFDQTSHF